MLATSASGNLQGGGIKSSGVAMESDKAYKAHQRDGKESNRDVGGGEREMLVAGKANEILGIIEKKMQGSTQMRR